MTTGVSVPLFAAVIKQLCKTFGGKPVPPEMFNRWITELGDIERAYEALPMPEKIAKTRKLRRKVTER